jgi:DNA-binding response OmpR family regulator
MSSERILLVDDHPDTLRLYETYLSLSGFEVTAVSSAIDALRHHAVNDFEAISTDLAMPGMDGVEFIRRIRQSSTHAIPIVAITGQTADAETTTRQRIDCCRLLVKPCDLEEVAGVLRFLIRECAHGCDVCGQRIEKIVVNGGRDSTGGL